MEFKRIQQSGGAAAMGNALIYVTAFVFYGGIFVYPAANASAAEEMKFLSDNQATLSIVNLVSYVLFGILLAVLVVALNERLKNFAPIFSKLTAVFGIIWVGLVIASGMIANVGLNTVIGMDDPEKAMSIWSSVSIVSEGFGGGNEIVGGIWVLLLSSIALKGKLLSKPLNFLGLLVGLAGVLTVYPLDIFTEIFGISQIIWFLWLGVFMVRRPIKA